LGDDYVKFIRFAQMKMDAVNEGVVGVITKCGHTVEAVDYSPEQQAVAINKSRFFRPIPHAVWDFHIGGYQVLDKYLKSREGRVSLRRRFTRARVR
jgi:hypothetical protein